MIFHLPMRLFHSLMDSITLVGSGIVGKGADVFLFPRRSVLIPLDNIDCLICRVLRYA
mgnify:FL=1